MGKDIREIYYSDAYQSYLKTLNQRVKEKYSYVEQIIKTIKVVNKKFVKAIEGTVFYEARVSVGSNEYRTILFAIDAENFIECSSVLFLNSFLKKDKKQYKKEIETATKILNQYKED